MKVLYLITLADGGGAQKYVLDLAKNFGGAVAAGTEESRLFQQANEAGLATFGLRYLKRKISPWHDLCALVEIYLLVRKVSPDIVHVNSTKAGFLGSIAAKLAGTKVVFTAHGFRHREPLNLAAAKLYLMAERFSSLFRDFVIAVSHADFASAKNDCIISEQKLRLVNNGIAPVQFLTRAEARRKLTLKDDLLTFVTVANYYPAKGLDILIRAVSKLSPRAKKICRFAIIGDGPLFDSTKKLIAELKTDDQILVFGRIDQAAVYLKAFDAFVLPSRKEGFPYALLEALQAGLPVVASNTGGTLEALGEAGLLVPPGNQPALTDALETVIAQPAFREQLATKSCFRSREFSLNEMIKKTEKVYRELIQQA